jgi:hypothetical protein
VNGLVESGKNLLHFFNFLALLKLFFFFFFFFFFFILIWADMVLYSEKVDEDG